MGKGRGDAYFLNALVQGRTLGQYFSGAFSLPGSLEDGRDDLQGCAEQGVVVGEIGVLHGVIGWGKEGLVQSQVAAPRDQPPQEVRTGGQHL